MFAEDVHACPSKYVRLTRVKRRYVKMRATLISPYTDVHTYGIRTLSACLKREEGCDVQLIFLPRFFTSKYKDKILNEIVKMSEKADLIGISLMTNFFTNTAQITQHLKQNLSAPIVWGGHPPYSNA